MRNSNNRQVVLAKRPEGIPQAEHFALQDGAMPNVNDGEVLVRNLYLSVDPAMRGWVNAVANYSEPVAIGAVMRSIAVGEIVESRRDGYAPGEIVCGMFGWQEYAAAGAEDIWFKHDPAMAPVTTALGILGINGLTGYFGLLDVGEPQAGDTVVVSTAAGAVGSAVGQIAKIKGCRTVGIAGGPDKVAACLDEFGYDAAIDYKTADLDAELKAACPDGIDVYFDNTSGRISDAVYAQLALRARVAICGTASIANWDPWPDGPRVERHLLVKRARMQGLLLFDFADRFAEARTQLASWLRDGKLSYREDVLDGLEAAPGAIQRLYAGENKGKLLIGLDDVESGR